MTAGQTYDDTTPDPIVMAELAARIRASPHAARSRA
jgi:hypothetical protein